jgi:uncharacterized membrane protein
MDEQLEKWKQSYTESTPTVDASLLIKQVKAARKKEQVKRWLDILSGCAVALFCIFTAVYYVDTAVNRGLLLALSLVPVCASIWAYRKSMSKDDATQMNVQQLLTLKRNALLNQLQYWRLSAWVLCLLFIGLFAMLFFNSSDAASDKMWQTIMLVQAPIVAFTVVRCVLLKRALPAALKKIDNVL